MKKITIVVATLAILALGAGTVLAAPFVTNGDFSAGNTGFTSAYLYFAQPGVPANGYTNPKSSLYDEGTYGVGTNPALYHALWASVVDHTTGSGNMMIVNGDTQPNVQYWAETVTGLTIGQTYYFSAWLTSIYPPPVGSTPISPAVLAFSVSGLGQLDGDITVSQPVGTWDLFYNSFVAGATTVTLSVINKNTVAGGNDFAMDDISLDTRNPVPEPATMLLLGLGLLGVAGIRRKFKG
jgi:hypothetical protein